MYFKPSTLAFKPCQVPFPTLLNLEPFHLLSENPSTRERDQSNAKAKDARYYNLECWYSRCAFYPSCGAPPPGVSVSTGS